MSLVFALVITLMALVLPADVHSADITLRCTTQRDASICSPTLARRINLFGSKCTAGIPSSWSGSQRKKSWHCLVGLGLVLFRYPCRALSAPPHRQAARTTYASAQLFTTQAVCRSFSGRGKTKLGHELIDTVDDTNLIDGRLVDKPARNGAGEQVS